MPDAGPHWEEGPSDSSEPEAEALDQKEPLQEAKGTLRTHGAASRLQETKEEPVESRWGRTTLDALNIKRSRRHGKFRS